MWFFRMTVGGVRDALNASATILLVVSLLSIATLLAFPLPSEVVFGGLIVNFLYLSLCVWAFFLVYEIRTGVFRVDSIRGVFVLFTLVFTLQIVGWVWWVLQAGPDPRKAIPGIFAAAAMVLATIRVLYYAIDLSYVEEGE